MHTIVMIYTCFTGPSALTVNITKNIENSSIIVQWDVVDDYLTTSYTVVWTSERDHNLQVVTLTEQSSYTITGLTFDTIYTIFVIAANRCGTGPEFTTSISLSADTTSTTSSISPTVTTSTNPMTIMSTANPNAATVTTTDVTITDTTTTVTTITSSTIATTSTIQLRLSTTTTSIKMNPSTTTTISMTTTVSRDTDTTSSTTKTASLMTVTSSMNPCTTVIADPFTITVTHIDMFPAPTGNPADTTTADDTGKFSSTYS